MKMIGFCASAKGIKIKKFCAQNFSKRKPSFFNKNFFKTTFVQNKSVMEIETQHFKCAHRLIVPGY